MIELYFITALVLTTNTIPTGWLQWTSSFPNKELCQEAVEKDKADIVFAVGNYFKKKFIVVKTIECMTYKEAVSRNSKLGH